MFNRFSLRSVAIALMALVAACTVKQDEIPSLTGPSEFGLSITITATPDSISQDGASQSAIVVFARGPNGAGLTAVPLRLDMAVNGVVQDFGTLSTKSIVTGSDGRAAAVYTAPPAPPPAAGGSGNLVTIFVTPTGSNFQAANSQSADIRLVPPGVILPPAPTPTASFTYSPTPVLVKLPINFDASNSCQGSPCTSTGLTGFQWNFGDGTTASGKTTTKTFTSAGTFNVTLTVTNDRGVSASTTQAVTVGSGTAPTASFVFSPSTPQILQVVSFNAGASRAAAGRTITSYSWDFGDGDRKTGVTTTHDFATAGAFNVVLTVTDDLGQTGTASQAVTVTGGGAPTASFVFSPTAPQVGQSVSFNGTASSAAPGRTIASYSWNFGDGGALGTGVTPTRAYTAAGTYNVVLTVTDNVGQQGTVSRTVDVTGGGAPTASFVFSPTAPQVGQSVVFNASASRATPGRTIASYSWDFGDGGAVGTGVTPTRTYSAAATYNVILTVTDSAGQTGTTSQAVAVSPSSGVITADFTISPTNPVSGALVTFNANTSSPLASINKFVWDFGDGTVITVQGTPPISTVIDHTYITPVTATFTIRLTASDSLGRTATRTNTLSVTGGTAPTANFTISPSPAPVNTDVTFNASTSVNAVRYEWNWGDGSAVQGTTTTPTTHRFTATGTYTIRLTVFDSSGRSNATSRTLVVQ